MIKAIAKANDNVILLLCGDGEQSDYMKELAKNSMQKIELFLQDLEMIFLKY